MYPQNDREDSQDWNWTAGDSSPAQGAYRQAHRRALAAPPGSDDQAQVEPYLPDYETAVAANQAALAEANNQPGFAGQEPFQIVSPERIQSALGRAENHLAYGVYENPDEAQDPNLGLIHAITKVGHGIAQAQAFANGNKRTGYWLMHHALHENGLNHVSPDDDTELADHFVGYGEGTHDLPDTVAMLKQRYINGQRTAKVWNLEPTWAE